MTLVRVVMCAALAQAMGTYVWAQFPRAMTRAQAPPPMTGESLARAVADRLEALPELNIEVQYAESEKPVKPGKEPGPTVILRASMARGGKLLVRAMQDDAELCGIASDGTTITVWDCSARKWTRFTASDPADYRRAVRWIENAPGRPRGLGLALDRLAPPWLDQPTGYHSFLDYWPRCTGATVTREDVHGRDCHVFKCRDSHSNGLISVHNDLAAAYDATTLLPVAETQFMSIEGLLSLFAQVKGRVPPYYSMRFRYDERPTDLAAELRKLEPPAWYTFVDPPPVEATKLQLVGQPWPSSLKLTSLDGADIPLTPQAEERCVVVLVWATWCNPCRVEKDALSKLAAAGELKGVRVVAVSVDQKLGTVRSYLKKHPVPFTVAWDPKFTHKLGAKGVPVTLLIDAKGVVCDGWTGFGEGQENVNKLRAAIHHCQE